MKIGIVTFHFSDNFGAALQAYALRAFLLEEGHDARFVNYSPAHVEKGGRFRIGFSKKTWIANLKVAYLKFNAIRSERYGNTTQKEEFSTFRTKWLGLNGPRYDSLEDLRQISEHFDLLICGSDQIWSPSVQEGLDPAYFLDFGVEPVRRISFAASFGSATIDSLRESGATQLMAKLDSIAVREKNGVGLVTQLTGRVADWVCDPTCLLQSYDSLIGSVENEGENGHVFCYALRSDQGVREVAMSVANLLDTKLIAPANPFSRWSAIGETRYPGPAGWLSLISRSKFVVTNSFHGTMFSVLLRKPFIVVGLPGKKVGLNDRMISLLERLGLYDRFLPAGDPESAMHLLSKEIDWDAVGVKLADWRDSSIDYLRREINLSAKK
ncbi:hypothetical protein HNR46_001067 [Haloferula luteola]|uniref:Polysaccharide pyruvyl transferase domain-containing protein n=1 Tax=Haloferula luteola TaxID=595692 RepID=A0A840V0J2_9BACT|nr:polysaccharide pyruvyl transferase family protein [Haloferula luteola]MBB5350833.1 hypothetical protein [Haloferula luteola]